MVIAWRQGGHKNARLRSLNRAFQDLPLFGWRSLVVLQLLRAAALRGYRFFRPERAAQDRRTLT